jgi:hypothetical protein
VGHDIGAITNGIEEGLIMPKVLGSGSAGW